jgi:hypothetical protein
VPPPSSRHAAAARKAEPRQGSGERRRGRKRRAAKGEGERRVSWREGVGLGAAVGFRRGERFPMGRERKHTNRIKRMQLR